MLQIYNGKFALLLLLKESSPAVLSSSSMWVHSINNDRETHRNIYIIIFICIWHHIYWYVASYILLEYGIIFIGICCHIYWNMLSYLLEYVIISIGVFHHIYWNMLSYLLEMLSYVFIVK